MIFAMFDQGDSKVVDGVAGNGRITGMVAVVLLVLVIAEAATIPFIGQLLGPHIFIGMLLLGPVALKLASTGLAGAGPRILLVASSLAGGLARRRLSG
jgi:hypothetical protein